MKIKVPDFSKPSCALCRQFYPSRFLTQMYVNGNYYSVDPKCALKIMGDVYGFPSTSFQGEVAQQLLEDFKDYLLTGGSYQVNLNEIIGGVV